MIETGSSVGLSEIGQGAVATVDISEVGSFNPNAQHPEVYTIAGILAPTNTPADRVIWIPLAGVQTMTGHDPQAGQ